MSAAERQIPEPLSRRTSALVVVSALLAMQLLPILVAAGMRMLSMRMNFRMDMTVMILSSAAASTLLALAASFLLIRRSGGVSGIHRLNMADWGIALLGLLIVEISFHSLTIGWGKLLLHYQLDFAARQSMVVIAANCPEYLFWGLFVLTAVLIPLLEEIVYRRSLYSLLLPLGKWAACFGAALIFGAVHFFLLGFPGLVLFGVILQWMFGWSKNLAVPIVIHGAFNAIALLLARYCLL